MFYCLRCQKCLSKKTVKYFCQTFWRFGQSTRIRFTVELASQDALSFWLVFTRRDKNKLNIQKLTANRQTESSLGCSVRCLVVWNIYITRNPAEFICFASVYKVCIVFDRLVGSTWLVGVYRPFSAQIRLYQRWIVFDNFKDQILNPRRVSRIDIESEKIMKKGVICELSW